ncbi:MAG: ATP-binding protein [Actinomycetota bacterium]|nr:ATP-binding protein [Actinomycetota bacterium]
MPGERLRLRIGNLAKAVLVSGQAYQDPKDALNEFVSNAADEYVEAGRRGERIRVMLRRKGRYPVIAVDDVGRGLSPERLREIARNLFESAKAGDERTLGEKAIGILAFQQLGGRCDVVSRAEGSDETWALRLERGKATARLERERRKARQVCGTTVVLSDLEPDVLRVLTQRKVVDYLRGRRGPALARGDYSIEVVEGRSVELVTPEKPDGIKLEVAARHTLWGPIEFALYVSPPDARRRRVAVVGRAGTTIVDDLTEIEEFAQPPWTTGQVGGQVVFAALQQSAGRRAVLRDRDAFPVFVDALKAVEPAVLRATEKLAHEVDAQTADRLAETLRRVFGRVLKELADVDNPMRTAVGDEPGAGALFEPIPPERSSGSPNGSTGTRDPPELPDFPEPGEPHEAPIDAPPSEARPDRRRSSDLPSVRPDPNPGEARSRFDAETGIVFYNDRHQDYLVVRDDEAGLLDYLATLVAKEYVLYNNPRAANEEFAEEMVRMLVRVRRHLPRRR